MKWTRIRIKTTTEAEDIIISTLYDIGLEGAQIEDKIPLTPLEKEQMFVDILPDFGEDVIDTELYDILQFTLTDVLIHIDDCTDELKNLML